MKEDDTSRPRPGGTPRSSPVPPSRADREPGPHAGPVPGPPAPQAREPAPRSGSEAARHAGPQAAPRPASWASGLAMGLAIVFFAAAFFAPEVFLGKVAATANMDRWRPWITTATESEVTGVSHNPDCNLSYYPRRHVLHEAWNEGRVPLWNPYSFMGAPFSADIQSGVFYPFNWVLMPLDARSGLGAFLVLHMAIAGIGFAVLVRKLGVGAGIATLAGAAFSLNGFMIKHFGQPTFLATAAWIPWVFAAALALREAPSIRRAGFAAVCGALLFLAGQPQIALHTGYAVALVLLVREFSGVENFSGGTRSKFLLTAGVAALVAGFLVAVQLWPTLELSRASARARLPFDTIVSGGFHPVDVARLAVEEFFGSPLTEDEWSGRFVRGDGFYIRHQLNSLFAGTPVFFLALFAVMVPSLWRAGLPFTILGLVAALVAFGTPLTKLAFDFVPGFRFARIDRLGVFVIFAQAVLAALFAQRIAESSIRASLLRVYGGLTLVCAVVGAIFVSVRGPQEPHVAERTRTAAAFAAGGGLALLLPAPIASTAPHALAAAQLILLGAPYRGDRDPADVFAPHASIDALREVLHEGTGGGRFLRFGRDVGGRASPVSSVLPPSTNVPYELRDLQGYNALSDSTLGRTLERALGEPLFSFGIWSGRRIVEPVDPASLDHPLLDALAVRAVTSAREFEAPGFSLLRSDGFFLYRNEEALPRFAIVPTGRAVDEAELGALLREKSIRPREEVVWLGNSSGEVWGSLDSSGAAPRVEVREDAPESLRLRCILDRPAVLVVADTWEAGWSARVNGQPARIERAYGLTRALPLEAGVHNVEMRYFPASLRWGGLLSGLALVALGGMIAWTRRTERR